MSAVNAVPKIDSPAMSGGYVPSWQAAPLPTNRSTAGISARASRIEVPPEPVAVVLQKAQAASTVLADLIAYKYLKDTAERKSVVMQQQDLLVQAQLAQRALAEAIATKYKTRKVIDTTIIPGASTVVTESEELRRRSQLADEAQLRAQYHSSGASRVQVSPAVSRGSHIIRESRGPPVITTNVIGQQWRLSATQNVDLVSEQDILRQNVVPRHFEVITEKPVVREIVVEKPYDVIVQRPIENRVEVDVTYEKYIDNPIERVIENEVERVVSKPVERIVEKPVVIEKIVQRPVENIVERFVDVVVERPVDMPRTVNVNVDRTVLQPVRNEVVVKESVVEVPVIEDVWVDKPYERIYERIVEVPVEVRVNREFVREVERPVVQDVVVEKTVNVEKPVVVNVPDIKRVKRSVVVDQVVEKPYEVVREVQKPIRRTVQKLVERPVMVDRVVDVPVYREVERPFVVEKKVEVPVDVEVPREVVVDRYVDVEVEQVEEVPVYVTRQVEVPVEKRVAKYIEVPREVYRDVEEINEIIVPRDQIIERRVQVSKVVPRTVEVERIVEVPVEKVVQKEIVVDKVVEKPLYIEKVVEKPVQRIVEKHVEVPFERFIEVPREVLRDKIIEVETIVEKPVYRDVVTEEPGGVIYNDKSEKLRRELSMNASTQMNLHREASEWRSKLENMRARRSVVENVNHVMEQTVGYEENRDLRMQLDQLHEEYNRIVDQKNLEYTQQFSQKPRISGFGERKVLGHGHARISQIGDSRLIAVNSFEASHAPQSNPESAAASYLMQGYGQGGQSERTAQTNVSHLTLNAPYGAYASADHNVYGNPYGGQIPQVQSWGQYTAQGLSGGNFGQINQAINAFAAGMS